MNRIRIKKTWQTHTEHILQTAEIDIESDKETMAQLEQRSKRLLREAERG